MIDWGFWRGWMHWRGSAKLVTRQGLPYLERFYLLAVGLAFRVFLHTFWMDDPDPLHDHPWPWGRIILRGSYEEFYHDGTSKVFGPGSILWRRDALVLHRVKLLTPSVTTIFWHWRRVRDWGFMWEGGWEQTPEEAADHRPMVGIVLPRKLGPPPEEA